MGSASASLQSSTRPPSRSTCAKKAARSISARVCAAFSPRLASCPAGAACGAAVRGRFALRGVLRVVLDTAHLLPHSGKRPAGRGHEGVDAVPIIGSEPTICPAVSVYVLNWNRDPNSRPSVPTFVLLDGSALSFALAVCRKPLVFGLFGTSGFQLFHRGAS